MIILLTGHQGFMGQHLYKRLVELGHEVYGKDKKNGTSTSD